NASATDSGLLLLPLMMGLLGASIFAGQVVSRTGRYRVMPIVGMAICCVGLLLLSTMNESTSRYVSGAYMLVFGIGIGCTMQILVLATQNAVEVRELGVATASVSFFRSVGGSIGVAIFGALFNNRFGASISPEFRAQTDVEGLTPATARDLPPLLRMEYV